MSKDQKLFVTLTNINTAAAAFPSILSSRSPALNVIFTLGRNVLAKKVKKVGEEELPSFLVDLTDIPEDVSVPPRPGPSDSYLGPIFFGQCNKYQPPLHSVNFSTFRHIEKTYNPKENIKDLFFPETKIQTKVNNVEFKLLRRRKQVFSGPYQSKYSGTRKAFVPEVRPPIIDLGESTSIIEGETILEIPLHRIKKTISGASTSGFELVKFSDIKEKKRNCMSYTERISHIHFPKEFATVSVVGPIIPAAITITKLPSKRKRQSVTNLLIKSKAKRDSKDPTKTNAEKSEVKQEPEVDLPKEGGAEVKELNGLEKNLETKETDGSNHQKLYGEQNFEETAEIEEDMAEAAEELIAEAGAEEETERPEVNEKTEEIEQEEGETSGEEEESRN